MRLFLAFCLSIIILPNLSAQTVNRMSAHRESQALIKGKKIVEQADCFYNSENLKLTVHAKLPTEYIKTISSKGELKMYFPSDNKLILKQNSYLATSKEELYIYLNNMYDDLGLRSEGFTMSSTRYEGEYMIIDWTPPAAHSAKMKKIEIVYENMMPIYAGVYNSKDEVYKKTYYSDYHIDSNLIIPQRVTDITYSSKTDSIVRRVIYSNIKINSQADSSLENLKIPENAKLIK